jgi:inhibitor of cysteine peptidase
MDIRRVMMVMLVAALAPAAAACGDDGDNGAGTPTARATAPVTAAPAATVSAHPKEVQLTDADAGKSVKLANGGKLIVALVSNPSTGFRWAVAEPAPVQLRLEGEPAYVAPGSTTPAVGAAGTEVFTFAAVSAGTATLTLNYARSFEPDVAPEKTFSITVDIK